ncbi:MAG: hypothetical protein IT177_14975 [Acidobacteria bacterium]|nr:hypothetical protein [Acidobacteriota bacterium]
MRRWAPWVAALVIWNLSFDYQLRRAGDAFVAEQLQRWRQGAPVELIRGAFRPQVRRAAALSTGIAAAALAASLYAARRRVPPAHR